MKYSPVGLQGTPFGRYRLLGELGHGGMGIVYRAVSEGPQGFSRACVIKRIVPHLARDPGFTQSLVAEARLSALLIHPGIVQVYELGEVDGEHYLAMEYVDGHTLIEIVRRLAHGQRPFPPGLVCYMIAELAAALAHAHALKDAVGRPLEIIHRDISPSNVMLSRTGTLKLLDFGIAKASSHVREEQTRTGTLKGKFAYMSPEQAEGLPIDRRSDLFSLGVVFWEILTLRRLFRTRDDMHTLRLVREADVPPTGVDPEIDRIVLKMLARNREDRFATGDDIAAALQPIATRLNGNAFTMRKFLGELPEDQEPAVAVYVPRQPEATRRSAEGAVTRLTPAPADGDQTTATRATGEVMPPASVLTSSAIRLTPPRGGFLVRASLVAAVLAVTGLVAATTAKTPVRGPAMAPAVVASPATPLPTAVTAPADIRLQIEGTAHAVVFVDSVRLGTVPLMAALPRRKGARTVELRKAGFVSTTQQIAGDSDMTLNVKLVRAAASRESVAKPSVQGDIKNPFAR